MKLEELPIVAMLSIPLIFVLIAICTLWLQDATSCAETQAVRYCLEHNSTVEVFAHNGVKCLPQAYELPEVHFWNETELSRCR